MKIDYTKAKIVNIRLNKRTGNLHANLVDENDILLIAATLDYIIQRLQEEIQ